LKLLLLLFIQGTVRFIEKLLHNNWRMT